MRERLRKQMEEADKSTGNGVLHSVRRSSSDWVFCNTELEPYPNHWSSEYRCPKCGNNLVNIIGTCATKVHK